MHKSANGLDHIQNFNLSIFSNYGGYQVKVFFNDKDLKNEIKESEKKYPMM